MKTPDEIKKGLECHTSDDIVSCYDCPYYYDCYETARSNGAVMAMDTLAYIRQLEKELAELRLLKSWDDFPERMGR